MNTTPKISVIVPVYNVKKYLNQCVDSILTQTLKEIEVILINDGSTDGCEDIINAYAQLDSRVCALTQENSGYGKTINRGLDAAHGEYIAIVESDDWIEPDMFESLYSIAKEYDVDLVKGNYYKSTTKKGDVQKRLLPENMVGRVLNPKIESNIFYLKPTIWSAIYKNAFLKSKHIRCLETPGASYQDVGFNFKTLAMADRVYLTSKPVVHYRCDNESSSVHSSGKIYCVADEWREIDRYMMDYPDEEESSRALRFYVRFNNYLWNLHRLRGKNRELFREVFRAEYEKGIQAGVIRKEDYPTRRWYVIQHAIYPYSLKITLTKMLLRCFSFIFFRSKGRCRKWASKYLHIRGVETIPPGFVPKEEPGSNKR